MTLDEQIQTQKKLLTTLKSMLSAEEQLVGISESSKKKLKNEVHTENISIIGLINITGTLQKESYEISSQLNKLISDAIVAYENFKSGSQKDFEKYLECRSVAEERQSELSELKDEIDVHKRLRNDLANQVDGVEEKIATLEYEKEKQFIYRKWQEAEAEAEAATDLATEAREAATEARAYADEHPEDQAAQAAAAAAEATATAAELTAAEAVAKAEKLKQRYYKY